MMENNVDKKVEETADKEVKKEKNAIDILKGELEEKHDPFIPSEPVIKHLIEKCKEDETLSKRVELEKKSIKECFEYMKQEITKLLNSKSGFLENDKVYGMAEHYYLSDEIKIEKPEPRVPSVPRATSTNTRKPSVSKTVEKKPEKEQISLFSL